MSEIDVNTIAHAAPYRRLTHYQVADWLAACERAGSRRVGNGVLQFCPRAAPAAPAHALLGLPRRRPVLPFVRRSTAAAPCHMSSDDNAA